MTVAELIEQLRKHDPQARVVVDGHEGGLDDVEECVTQRIKPYVNTEWYYGPHDAWNEQGDNEDAETAVYLVPGRAR